MDKCPVKVTVLLYNDKEGYGIAQTKDTFVPKEVTALKNTDALALLSSIKPEPNVYIGLSLAARNWSPVEVANG